MGRVPNEQTSFGANTDTIAVAGPTLRYEGCITTLVGVLSSAITSSRCLLLPAGSLAVAPLLRSG